MNASSSLLDESSPGKRGFGSITLRSILMGLCCVVFIAAYAPYNDFVLINTNFIMTHLPVGITSMMLVFILCLNPLLRTIRPGSALRPMELIVIWAMCLVAGAFPNTGLMRQLIPWMVAPIYYLSHHPDWSVLLDVFPAWMFPTTDPGNDEVIAGFMLGKGLNEPLDVPWGAWVGPLIYRGLYYVPLFLGMLLLAVLMSRQWIVHEKLQYPIASMMLDMVREAPKGRPLNVLFTNRQMWVGAGVVMAIHLIKGLHAVFPKVPDIPLGYNLNAIFTEGFWFYLYWYIKVNDVYFTMVGVAFLMSSQVSLSLWFFLVLQCFIAAAFVYQGVSPYGVIHTQTYGAVLAMGGMLLFLARAHLWRALRVAFSPARDRRDTSYRSYRWVVWGLILCIAVASAWQWMTGMPFLLALAHVTMVFVSNLVLARIVAETGMFFVSGGGAGMLWPASPESRVLWTFFGWPAARGAESLMPYAFNALWLRHAATEGQPRPGEEPRGHATSGGFIAVLVAAMLISMVVSAAVWIAIYYSEGLVRTNAWIGIGHTIGTSKALVGTLEETTPGSVLPSLMHIATGAVMVVLMGICRWRIPRWPFVPIALCMGMSNEMGFMWFSIFIGWACKSVVMRTGGVLAYQRLRPMFLGMVLGELFMAGAWMAFGAFVKLQGLPISPYRILPTHGI